MCLLPYIETIGTGTADMTRRCTDAGLPEPDSEPDAGFMTRNSRDTGIGKQKDDMQPLTHFVDKTGFNRWVRCPAERMCD